jgi:general secretion pathway protein F
MALFQYKAFRENGKKISGKLCAENLQEAQGQLSRQKVLVTFLAEIVDLKKTTSFKKKDILCFTQELARLLSAGLPLYESILSLEEKYAAAPLQSFLLDLTDQLKAGRSFSEGLRGYTKSFDFLYCAMVANAEKTGTLEQTLKEISRLLARQEKLKSQILSTLLYPAFLLGFSLLVIFVLLFYILPSLFELFEGRSLHPLTSFVLSCSHLATSHKGLLGLIFFSFLSFFSLSFFSTKLKKALQRFFLRVPFAKNLFLKVGFVRYFRSLSTLLEGGVPLLEALALSRKVMEHPLLDQQMAEAERRVAEGWNLSTHLDKSSLVPKWVCRMVSVAEKTGDLCGMLRHIAEIYEEEIEKSLAQIATFLQPFFLLVLGIIVGVVVLSVLIPLTDVSSFLST